VLTSFGEADVMNLFGEAIGIGPHRGSRRRSLMCRRLGILGAAGLRCAVWAPGNGPIQTLNSGGGQPLSTAAVAIVEDC
jgi:hypothetical protein